MNSEANVGTVAARSTFYIFMGLVALAVAVTGFSTTYFLPVAGGKSRASGLRGRRLGHGGQFRGGHHGGRAFRVGSPDRL